MKGIIIASFGSIYQDAVEKSIGSIEKKVRSMYSDMGYAAYSYLMH